MTTHTRSENKTPNRTNGKTTTAVTDPATTTHARSRTKISILSLILALFVLACSPAPDVPARLVPRYAVRASGTSVALDGYYDLALRRPCAVRPVNGTDRCVPTLGYAQVYYTTATCTGTGLADLVYLTDIGAWAGPTLVTACTQADPTLKVTGPFWTWRTGRCDPATADEVYAARMVQICPVDMYQFATVGN